MLVFVQSNYKFPDLLRQTNNGDGRWEDIQFTFDEVEQCDYIVVINHPVKDIHMKCRIGGKILLIQEPPYERNDYLTSYFPYFDKVISAFDKKKFPLVSSNLPSALPWHINKNFSELLNLKMINSEKLDKISWVTSNSDINLGHKFRLKFLEELKQSDLPIDLYGRGINPIDDKFDGVFPYKYTLAIENYSDENYWTEKITDAFLSYTMPVYYGCKNIEAYFPEGSFIQIDIHKPQEAIQIIKNALKNNFWEKNINEITLARNLILNKYQFFPFIKDIINHSNCPEIYASSKIPAQIGQKNNIIKQIKNFFR